MSNYDGFLIGDALRELRKKNHLTQMELAEKLNISYIHYSQIEQGRHKMSIDLLFRVMTLFHVDANTILGIKHTQEKDERLCELSGRVAGLKPSEQKCFMETCRLLLDGLRAREERMAE